MKKIRVAVSGQPNVGKSTLFNVLTNNKVQVANWPGVTVERHEGRRVYKDYLIEFIDLPGIYGFSSLTIEERIARRYILSGEPDVLLILVDSMNPERTMYLALQALELMPKTILVFTKSDLVHVHGIHINYEALEHRLKTPVVPVSAATGRGIEKLLETIVEVAEGRKGRRNVLEIDYGELNPFIESIYRVLEKHRDKIKYPLRWAAVRLLEGDDELEKEFRVLLGENVLEEIRRIRGEAEEILKRSPAEIASIHRFEYISRLLEHIVIRTRVEAGRGRVLTKYLYNPLIGPLLGVSILVGVFLLAFIVNTGFPLNTLLEAMGYSEYAEAVETYSLSGLMDQAFTLLGDMIYNSFGESPITHLVVDGILGGVGAILVFLPLIIIVSFTLALLEDSGLAPRIAVSMHNLLSKIGVSGHAVFPMTLSLGCNVPAILAARATPDPRERFRLILTLPFIPCQARLVVILALATALRSYSGGLLILYGYAVAFLVFVAVNKILYIYDRRRGYVVSPEILLEIPPLHKPLPRVVWWLTWSSTKHFLLKAGIVIFLSSILIWGITSYSPTLEYVDDPGESIAASLSRILAPLLSPVNIVGEKAWIPVFALVMGFVAKEIVISALMITTGAEDVRDAVEYIGLNDPQVAAITVFSILYVPCLATLAVIYSETRSIKYMLLAIAMMMAIAYIVMIITYYMGIIL